MYKIIILIVLLLCSCLCINPLLKSREGLESHTDCLKQGYPHDFCLNVPQQAMIYQEEHELYEPPVYKPFLDGEGVRFYTDV